MAKTNFLLVDLNEPKTKKLAETITSDTSRRILNHLVEKEDTEANIARQLDIPISTIHYHLQKLQEAGLVNVEEFHYSQKGREVNHYKLANKYIIIAPGKVSGLKEKLKGILPVAGVVVGISIILKLLQSRTFSAVNKAAVMESEVAQEALYDSSEALKASVSSSSPDIAFWFFTGGLASLGVYLLVALLKEYLSKRK